MAEIVTPSISSPSVVTKTKIRTSALPSIGNNSNVDNDILERKIILATEGFITRKFCELILRDRNRLSKENALTICDYIIAMKREVNPRLTYKRYTIQILSKLSKAVGIQKKFIDMTRDDILYYLDNGYQEVLQEQQEKNKDLQSIKERIASIENVLVAIQPLLQDIMPEMLAKLQLVGMNK
jgi:hypothetical protein